MANLPRSVDDPFAAELLGDGSGSAAAAEEIGHEIAFVAAGEMIRSNKRLVVFVSGSPFAPTPAVALH